MSPYKTILLILFTIISNIAISQPENLVPNPSFEEYWLCPSNQGQIARVKGWRCVNTSPDYYHECSSDPSFDVPSNAITFQYPRTGSAYVGLGYYVGSLYQFCENGNSEIISTRLKKKLEVNRKYYVTFFVNYPWIDGISLVGSRMQTNKIGILFSTKDYSIDTSITNSPYGPFYGNFRSLPNFCHVYANEIIKDTLNWVPVSGSFIADSAYEYINIGIFFEINYLDTIMVFHYDTYPLGVGTYYLIDDIYVGTEPYYVNYIINNDNLFDIKVIGNSLVISTKVNNFFLRIYDICGRIIFFKNIQEEEYCLDLKFLANGIYLVEVNDEKNIEKKKILKF